MLTEIYIEALLVDEELSHQVWEAWDKGEIDDQIAWLAWWLIAFRPLCPRKRTFNLQRRPIKENYRLIQVDADTNHKERVKNSVISHHRDYR